MELDRRFPYEFAGEIELCLPFHPTTSKRIYTICKERSREDQHDCNAPRRNAKQASSQAILEWPQPGSASAQGVSDRGRPGADYARFAPESCSNRSQTHKKESMEAMVCTDGCNGKAIRSFPMDETRSLLRFASISSEVSARIRTNALRRSTAGFKFVR